MEVLMIGLAIAALVGYAIGNSKGEGSLGCVLGGLLGPIGWLISAVRAGHACPYCRKGVDPRALLCPHCRSSLNPSNPSQTVATQAAPPVAPGGLMLTCPRCGRDTDAHAERCTHCHRLLKSSYSALIVAIFVAMLLVIFVLASRRSSHQVTTTASPTAMPAETITPLVDVAVLLTAQPSDFKRYIETGRKTVWVTSVKKEAGGSTFRATTSGATVEVFTYRNKNLWVLVQFSPPVPDRTVALAKIGLLPSSATPTIDAPLGPRWPGVFPGIDEVDAIYQQEGDRRIRQVAVTPDAEAEREWRRGQ